MSFRPRFRVPNATFNPRFNNNNFAPSPNNFTSDPSYDHHTTGLSDFTNYGKSRNADHLMTGNTVTERTYAANKPNQESLPPNRFCSNTFPSHQPVNSVSFRYPNSTNRYRGNLQNSGPHHPSFSSNSRNDQYYLNQPVRQNFNENPMVDIQFNPNNSHFDSDKKNTSPQRFPITGQNAATPNNSSMYVNFEGYQNRNNVCHDMTRSNISTNYNTFPPNFSVANENSCNLRPSSVNNSNQTPGIINCQASVPVNHITSLMLPPPPVPNLPQIPPPQWENKLFLTVPPPTLGNNSSPVFPLNNVETPLSEKELKIADFLAKFSVTEKKNENKITVPEYRSALKDAFSLINLLSEKRSKLSNLIKSSDNEWNSEMQSINNLQKQLSEMCSLVSAPNHLSNIKNKLKCIKKKRNQKKKTKLNKFSEKIKVEQNRKQLHQEIDKWLDDIKEKNLKLKREVEMKKEADFILLEVRRKIQEANRTIEKIKVLEKLRNARQATSSQKGLHILPEHNEKFEKNVSILKKTMLRQLADYEAEEKALKVMLETEQEGQLEEKVQWELKRAKTVQQRRQNHINEYLFGISEEPLPTDPLYLFHKYHTSANNGIENLVQIRHQWDSYIAEDGESIPQHWVVPVAPSDSSWEKCLIASKS